MKHLRLYEEYSQYATSSNDEIVSLIAYFAKKLRSYTERNMQNHQHYGDARNGLMTLKEEIRERISRSIRMEQGSSNKMINDIMKELFREEGRKIEFSVGMWKTLLKTINQTLRNNKLTIVVEGDDDYVLYDEEIDYLKDLLEKYKEQEEKSI